MATVMVGMQIDATEEIGDDGLTGLQRKVFYRLVCKGEVQVSLGSNQEYELATGLGLQPGMGREINIAMSALMEMGRVKRYLDTKRADGYGGRHEVRMANFYHYRAIDAVGYGRPVLAWLYVYDKELVYDENRAADGTCYKSKIAEAMGDTGFSDDELLADVAAIQADALAPVTEESDVPAKWPGGHGQTHDILVTRVTIGRITA